MSTGQAFSAAHADALNTLKSTWQAAVDGSGAQIVGVVGERGTGRKGLVTDFLENAQAADKPILPLRIESTEGEDGLRLLLRVFAALYTGLNDRAELKAAVLTAVEGKLAQDDLTEPQKIWFQAFKEGMEKEVPKTDEPTFQVTVPKASPYLGLLNILTLVNERAALVFDIGDAQNILSFTFWSFLSSQVGRANRNGGVNLFTLRFTPLPSDEAEKNLRTASLLRNALTALKENGTYTEVQTAALDAEGMASLISARYDTAEAPAALVEHLMTLTHGIADDANEILSRLEEQKKLLVNGDGKWKLDIDAAALKPQSLLPALPGGDEAKLRRALQVAALEGELFTSSIVAQVLDLPQAQVDDLFDELEEHIDEVVFHEALKTWIYRFKTPLFRRQTLLSLEEHARKEQARVMADLLEKRYAARALDFAVKAARLWREAGEPARALRLIGLASSMERPDILQMGYEILVTDTESKFAAPIVRGLLVTLLEKLSASGHPGVGLQVATQLESWAMANDATELSPWVSQYRARFHLRMGKPADAAPLAEEARSGFAKAKNPLKEGETLALMGSIELARSEAGKAMEYAQRALKLSTYPPVEAQANFIKGIVHKSRGELQPAVEHLRKALDLSARTGLLPLHADTGLNLAETLLMGNNPTAALQLLQQLLNFTRHNKLTARERGVLSLTGKAHAGLKDFDQALQFTSQALKVARDSKNKLAEAADLFDMGLFSYMAQKWDEAQIYLKEADQAASAINHQPLLTETHFHRGLVATALKDLDAALVAYQVAEKHARAIKNERRLANILFNSGAIHLKNDTLDKAKAYLTEAQPLVAKYGNPNDKKGMEKALRKLDRKMH